MGFARIAVVGGGIAGLTAARALAERGFDVRVLERAGRPGGRAATASVKSFRFEPGAHLLSVGDRHLLATVERTGLAGELLPLRPVALAQVQPGAPVAIASSGTFAMPRLPGIRLHQALRVPRLERLLARFAPHLSPHEPERGGPHDDRSIADFARLYFGSSVLERWLEPFLSDTLVCEPEESSRVFLLMQLAARHGCFRGNLRGDLDRIAQGLSPESGVRLGEEVIGLEPAGQRQLRVHHRGEAGESATEAEAVVLALPAAQALDLAPDLLAGAEKDFFAATRYASVASLAVGLDRPAARHATRVRVPAAEGWPITALALEPGVPGGRIPEGRGLALLLGRDAFARAHEDASDESIAAALLPYLERLYPATRSGISWTRVTRYPRALPRFDVGRYRALARLRRVEKDRRARGRRLYFAGDHLVAPTLEGAVVSGLRAAKAVAEDLGGAD